jgi:hypothetical protein
VEALHDVDGLASSDPERPGVVDNHGVGAEGSEGVGDRERRAVDAQHVLLVGGDDVDRLAVEGGLAGV